MKLTPGHTDYFVGEFKVKLPDGRLQITSYLADDDGYRPQITYTYDGDADVPIIVKKPPVLPGNLNRKHDILEPIL